MFLFLLRTVFLTVDLERKTGITGVPFGRTEVSIPFVWSFFELYRRHGPVGPSLQGMPEQFEFHAFFGTFFYKNKNENG